MGTNSNADIAFMNSHLVKTLDKTFMLSVLREWRKDSTCKEEADAFADIIDLIAEGHADG